MSKTDLGVALVTGASSCIGWATAQALKRAGCRIFGTSRRAVPPTSDDITMLICDVTDDREWPYVQSNLRRLDEKCASQ
jgi:NADP-dependent 3-hydroxy acid dehydrogenase YdfG